MTRSVPCDIHPGRRCCTSKKRGGGDCHAWGLQGTDPPRCHLHVGHPEARAKAMIRAELAKWTDNLQTLDPGVTLLRLMTVAYMRAEQHADQLDALIKQHGWLEAFVGDSYTTLEDGRTFKTGEYAKRLAMWEANERKHAADLAVRAVAAGLEERRVRAEEAQVVLFAQALDAALAELGLEDRAAELKHGVSQHIRAIAS